MDLGVHVADFTWPSGPQGLAKDLTQVAKAAEDTGFTKFSVMDHVWQIEVLGPPEHEMLEAYAPRWAMSPPTRRRSSCSPG